MPASSIYNAAMRNHRGLLIGVAALVIPITVLGVLMLLERRPAPVDWLEQGAVDERVNPDSFGLLRPGMRNNKSPNFWARRRARLVAVARSGRIRGLPLSRNSGLPEP